MEDFIPVVGDCAYLQWTEQSDGDWFRRMAAKTDAIAKQGATATLQGMYIAGADGTPYGWINWHESEAVIAELTKALANYKAAPPKRIDVPRSEAVSTLDDSTSVVRVFTRIRPIPKSAGELNRGIGRDHLWIYYDDLKQIADAARSGQDEFAMPNSLANRIIRYHLHDNVRGEPDRWLPEAVKTAEFSIRVLSRTDAQYIFSFKGSFKMEGPERGLEGSVNGYFEVSRITRRVSKFRAYGESSAWGASRFTKVDCPAGKFPLVFAMIETDDEISKTVPPEFYRENDYKSP